jgi:hypothetical protein
LLNNLKTQDSPCCLAGKKGDDMKMIRKRRKGLLLAGLLLAALSFVYPAQRSQDGKLLPYKVNETIAIDGVLNEDVWKKPGIEAYFIALFPNFGIKSDKKNVIWAAYDSNNLYFAIKCYDPEPDKIKTSLTQRDKIAGDDWVGVTIDAMGSRQTAYEFYVNPSGIQMDYLNSVITGPDISPDFVWDSAAKITPEGYQVEMRIPLKSIQYKSGKEVEMGVLFRRHIPRDGLICAWPEVKAGTSEYIAMAPAVYQGLKITRKVEILPSFTYSSTREKESPSTWLKFTDTAFGVSMKYGLNSATTAEVTINPDFSQVESDAYQVEVNQRYPIFYTEKRPFFMEGMDLFNFGTIFFGHLVQAVDTRMIVDPTWAAKLSGTSKKISFAFLAADDKSFGRVWDPEEGINPYEDKNALYGVGRLKFDLGGENSLGVIYSGRHFSGGRNDAVGADIQYRLLNNLRINIAYLYTLTREGSETSTRTGNGFNVMMLHIAKHYSINAAYERYDHDFFMATAFQNRIDLSRLWLFGRYRIYPKIEKMPWLLQVSPFFLFSRLHDLDNKMNDQFLSLGFNLVFTRNGYFEFELRNGQEAWAGQLFDQDYINTFAWVQLFKWVYLEANFKTGDQIYYDPEEPFFGHGTSYGFGFNLQPNERLNLTANYTHTHFNRIHTSERIYNVDIYNVVCSYQFNKYFFIRGVLRYDNYENKLLTDLLASFTLIPGTVVHLGYGSLYEERLWQNGQWVRGLGSLTDVKNNLFLKVSYLWRLK